MENLTLRLLMLKREDLFKVYCKSVSFMIGFPYENKDHGDPAITLVNYIVDVMPYLSENQRVIIRGMIK